MKPFHVEVILSPDLQLAEKIEAARVLRVNAAPAFKIGDRVQAGATGCPGILESITPEGFASIRWDDGSLLCGVEADRLQHAPEKGQSHVK